MAKIDFSIQPRSSSRCSVRVILESLATIHYHRPKSQKRGRLRSLPLFLAQTYRSIQLYLVFASSFFSSAFSGIGAASLAGSLGVAGGAGSAGAAGAGGGGGGAGSSCLPHPIIVRDKAKSVITDNETNFFLILDSPPFPSHVEKSLAMIDSVSHNSFGYSSVPALRPGSPFLLFTNEKASAKGLFAPVTPGVS